MSYWVNIFSVRPIGCQHETAMNIWIMGRFIFIFIVETELSRIHTAISPECRTKSFSQLAAPRPLLPNPEKLLLTACCVTAISSESRKTPSQSLPRHGHLSRISKNRFSQPVTSQPSLHNPEKTASHSLRRHKCSWRISKDCFSPDISGVVVVSGTTSKSRASSGNNDDVMCIICKL